MPATLNAKQVSSEERPSNQVLVQYYQLLKEIEENIKLDEVLSEKKKYSGKNYSPRGFAKATKKLETLLRNQALAYPALTHVTATVAQLKDFVSKIDTDGISIVNPEYQLKSPFARQKNNPQASQAFTPFQRWLEALNPKDPLKLLPKIKSPAVVLVNNEKEFITAQPTIKILLGLGHRINISTNSKSKRFWNWLGYQFNNRYRNTSELKLVDFKQVSADMEAGQVRGMLIFGEELHSRLIETDPSHSCTILSVRVEITPKLKVIYDLKNDLSGYSTMTIAANKAIQKISKEQNAKEKLIEMLETLYRKNLPGSKPHGILDDREYAKAMRSYTNHPDDYLYFKEAKELIQSGTTLPRSLHEFNKLFQYSYGAITKLMEELLKDSKPTPSRQN